MSFADTLFLGNVVTVEGENARAEAVAVKDGIITFVGSAEDAQQYCGPETKVLDYGNHSIYPGFMEAHCHPFSAGKNLYHGYMALLKEGETIDDYIAITKRFVDEHPGRKLYEGMGFELAGESPTAAMLDKAFPNQAIYLISLDGHSGWMNTKAMEMLGLDAEFAKEFEPGLVAVDDNGNPTGFVAEAPFMKLAHRKRIDVKDGVEMLKCWQQFCFGKGYTACYDAGVELTTPNGAEIYQAAIESDSLMLRTYGGCMIDESCHDIAAAVSEIARKKESIDSEYFKIIGIKTFADGVVENHTAYLTEPYADTPENYGTGRMVDHESLVQLYEKAANHSLNVHVHTIGDAAVKCHLDAIQAVQDSGTPIDCIRPALAHLELVRKEDISRFSDLHVSAVVAPLWTPKGENEYPTEVQYLGSERADSEYPIRSFVETSVNTAFHTDYPVSSKIDIPRSVFTAVMRRRPDQEDSRVRGTEETITRYEALCSLTKNVANLWGEEGRLGTISVGKIANLVVFDKDFLNDEIEAVDKASLINTIVDGNIVWPVTE